MKSLKALRALLLTLLLAGCAADREFTTPPPGLRLTIAHINDHHSQLAPFSGIELRIDGVPTLVELGGFARVTTAFGALDRQGPVLKLHAGDAITGTLYYTLFKGEADAAMMGTVCFDAQALGNHEFDDGDAALGTFLDRLSANGCGTPVLAANVHPAPGTPLAPSAMRELIAPHAIRMIDGVPVGVIGITVAGKTMKSSRPLPTTRFENEALAAQRAIDALKARGVRHLVLLTHQGYEADRALAAQLTDVDAIIGGDSHTLLGDFSAFGLESAGPYPTVARNRDGKPVCIGQAWEYAKAIGTLDIAFDAHGDVLRCGGRAALLIGDSFRRRDARGDFVPVDAETRASILRTLASAPGVRVTAPDPVAAGVLARFTARIAEQKALPIGSTDDALCLVRVPGEATNRSAGVAGCEAANRLARGSDIAQVVADAFLAGSLAADIALQNAGGVRIPVPAGQISMETAFRLLPFSNILVELRLSGAQVREALEDAVSHHLDDAGSDGAHPYAAGLRWRLDMSRPRGQRFSALEVRDRASGQWHALDPARHYTVVTHDFIASGADGYATLGRVFAAGDYVRNYLLYTQTFVDHARANGRLARPSAADYSHQSVIGPDGRALR